MAQRDIRGLIALFQGGELKTFIEPFMQTLVPRGVEMIRVPDKAGYRSINADDLMSEYHSIVSLKLNDQDELRLLDSLLHSLENEAQWSRINRRRFHLITKKHSIGLAASEIAELDELQRLTDKQADLVHPLPFSELAMVKTFARTLGFVEPDSNDDLWLF